MNHAERVKELAQEFAVAAVVTAIVGRLGDSKPSRDEADKKAAELLAAIDAMQSALDDAVAKLAARDAEVATLHRWKSTNAPRLESLQGLLKTSQKEAHAGFEAVATLASEREANSILTAEVERLQNMLFAAGAMEEAPCFCCGYNGPGYFQPEKHSCASRHHTLSEEVKGGE